VQWALLIVVVIVFRKNKLQAEKLLMFSGDADLHGEDLGRIF
jgi:hypothetical protein